MSIETMSRDARASDVAISPVRFAHMVLRTSQFQIMRDWYLNFLNGRVVLENEFLCFQTFDDEHHRLAIVNMPDLKKATRDSTLR